MSRRHKSAKPWTRPALIAIAVLGSLLTAYLTVIKVTGSTTLCPTEGCTTVLTSSYAEVFGLPLALFGLAAYGFTGALASIPLLLRGDTPDGLESEWEQRSWLPLFLLTTAMAFFSGYLVYLLITEIHAFCLYCVISALFSLSLWLVTIFGHHWEDIGELFFNGVLVSMGVLVFSVFLGAPTVARQTPTTPTIVQPSSPAAIALAEHLSKSGAVMYGAYWCPHCQDQKKLFGTEGAKVIPYVECDASGDNAQPEKCRAAGIDGFPTWKIGEQTLSGTQELSDLANASGYSGSRQF